jgi:hypothetical protein
MHNKSDQMARDEPKVASPGEFCLEGLVETYAATHRFGKATARSLYGELSVLVGWAQAHHDPSKGDFESFLQSLLRKKLAAFTAAQDPDRLAQEWDDEKRRELAHFDAQQFLTYVSSLVTGCRWWPTPGSEASDFRQQCMLAALEALAQTDGFRKYERPGERATLLLCRHQRDVLRGAARAEKRRMRGLLGVLPTTLTPYDHLLAGEKSSVSQRFLPEMLGRANKAQRRWLAALRAETLDGDQHVVAAHMARDCQRNRSSATRALMSLQELAISSSAGHYLISDIRRLGRGPVHRESVR